MKIRELLEYGVSQSGGDSPDLDAQLVTAHVLGKPRTWLLAHLDARLTKDQIARARQAFTQLQSGTPLPYLLGHWEFFGLEFDLTSDVLIPRPETELLVEKAIRWLQASPERRTVADIGTGSGVIAITLAVHVPDARILATDISFPALKVARRNALKFSVQDQVDLLQCELLPHYIRPLPTERHFDLICANLPYIPTDKLHSLPIFGREPALALDGGADGLEIYRRLFKLMPEWLAPGGKILLEIENTLGPHALSLAFDSFSENITMHLHQDLAGYDRLLEIMLP